MTIISIDSAGTVRSQYTDSLAALLRDIGPIHVERASHVEFCNEHQAWFVDMLENPDLSIGSFRVGPFSRRKDALWWEIDYIQSRLLGLSDAEACKLAGKEVERENEDSTE